MRVLVTGSTGFVGRHLLVDLKRHGYDTLSVVRSDAKAEEQGLSDVVIVNDLSDRAALRSACKGIDAIVHLAGLAHVMNGSEPEVQKEYFRVNVSGTRSLISAAMEQRVKKFVFVSSIKVNGEATSGTPFSADLHPQPADAYGRSKLEAENIVENECKRNGCNWAIVRPPLIYGPGVRANFSRLMGLVESKLPLPLGLCKNRRALLFVGNLTSLIIRTLEQADGPDCRMLVSDGVDLSVAELVRAMGEARGISPLLFPVPKSLLVAVATVLGQKNEMRRLTQSLEVDMESTCQKLNWQPPFSIESALRLSMQD